MENIFSEEIQGCNISESLFLNFLENNFCLYLGNKPNFNDIVTIYFVNLRLWIFNVEIKQLEAFS